jgi:fused signal recognition particle receptor
MLKLFRKIFTKIDEEMLEELEENLILADCGSALSGGIIGELRQAIKEKGLKTQDEVKNELKSIIKNLLGNNEISEISPCYLIVGVNGVGKTTTIGKLAYKFRKTGKSVLLAAGDTFRAAAAEQLEMWAERAGCDIVRQQEGADPASVVFDAISAAKARQTDVVIIDTAGRLHNKQHLMEELAKIKKVVNKSGIKSRTLLVIDANTGQNGLNQAKSFAESADVDGIILTKMDATSKGGIVLAIKKELGIPVEYVGVGESLDDFMQFDVEWFIDELI